MFYAQATITVISGRMYEGSPKPTAVKKEGSNPIIRTYTSQYPKMSYLSVGVSDVVVELFDRGRSGRAVPDLAQLLLALVRWTQGHIGEHVHETVTLWGTHTHTHTYTHTYTHTHTHTHTHTRTHARTDTHKERTLVCHNANI